MRWTGQLAMVAIVALGCGKKSDSDRSKAEPVADEAKASDAAPPPVRRSEPGLLDSGLSRPSAVVYDSTADKIFIANLGAKGTVRPYVVRDEAGDQRRPVRVVDSAALREPRGMAILGDTLYVADLDRVHAYHRETFEIQPVIEVEGAQEIVALSAGPKVIYAADRAGNAIYRIDPATAASEVVASGDELGGPSALVAVKDLIWVVGETSGEIYALNHGGERIAGEKLPFARPVGLATLGADGFLVVDGDTGDIHLGAVGGWRVFVEGVAATGPIDVDRARGHILVPRAASDSVRLQPLP